MSDDLQPAFLRLRKAAAALPEVEESSWFNTPSLKVRGKSFARVKDAGTVVLMCALEDKEFLFETAPGIFFETALTEAGRRSWSASTRSRMMNCATGWRLPGG